jgi:hypothetical protein
VLLGQDWIHANECIPSTLHQCVMQWVGDKVEVIKVDDTTYVVLIESQVDVQGRSMRCLMGRDLTEYDYISVERDRFVSFSVKSMTSVTQLTNDVV